jgi:TRAP-type C4-dicarboxylate transport system substrate-binding protein
MNLKTWNALPPKAQEAFMDISKKYIPQAGAVWDNGDKAGREFTLDRGNKIVPLSDEESARWAKAVEPVIQDYVNRADKKGLNGADYVATLKELIKKYK